MWAVTKRIEAVTTSTARPANALMMRARRGRVIPSEEST